MTAQTTIIDQITRLFGTQESTSSSEQWEDTYQSMANVNIISTMTLIGLSLLRDFLVWTSVPSGQLVHKLDNFFLPIAFVAFMVSMVVLAGVLPLLSIFRHDEWRPAYKSGATAIAVFLLFVAASVALTVLRKASVLF